MSSDMSGCVNVKDTNAKDTLLDKGPCKLCDNLYDYYLFKCRGWLHNASAGHNVAADHNVGVHLSVTILSDAGHEVGEGRVLRQGDRGRLHGGSWLDLEAVPQKLGWQCDRPLVVTSHIIRLSVLSICNNVSSYSIIKPLIS